MGQKDVLLISTSKSAKCDVQFVKFKKHSILLKDDGKKSIAINPITKKPYVVWFVNNSSTGKNDGTFKNPFFSLSSAQNSAGPFDIIYIYPGNGTDLGMSSGISPLKGQMLLGAGKTYNLKTTLGYVKIPAFADGLPSLSNTNSTSSSSFNVVSLQFGNNVVAGLNLIDNIGGATLDSFLDQSGGVRINNNFDYLITHNVISTFNNATLPQPGGIGIDIFGGGNVKFKDNKVIGGDSLNAITFGVWMRSAVAPFQGFFKFKRNIFTGADENSGLNAGFVIAVIPFSPTFGNVGDLSIKLIENVCNSQSNTGNDHGEGIFINTFPIAGTSIKVKVEGNKIVIPAGITFPTAGIQINGNGPGLTEAILHKNVSLTTPPVPGYLFSNSGDPANLDLDMGYDNFGTSSGP